jgi:filamentous hemagglutinin family protein
MKTKNISLLHRATAAAMIFAFASAVQANPTGLSVSFGTAVAQQTGSQLNITAGNNAVLNWQSFNIAAGERTIFNQPSATSIVWNRINDPNPSQIFGTIQANGVVVLLNNSGFYFGPNSFVSAAGLVVSTANYAPPQNGGSGWEFNGPPPLASIVNYGHIQVGNAGSAFLIADKIENHGDLEAPGGSIGLAAGQTVTLSERPDGRGMSMNVVLPQGSVDNYGNIVADAGTIALNAKVVNQNGFIQANSVQNQNGVIELVADDQLNLGANSQISAQGDNSTGGSAGGSVTLQSGNRFSDVNGSQISVAGGANGGNGGAVEISAPVMPALNTKIDGHAQAGSVGGKLLLDPDYIILDTSGGDSVGGSGTVAVGSSPGGTLDLNVNSAFTGFSQIKLQAKYDILLADGTFWSLSDSTGQTSGQLTLEAGRNIIFGNTTALYDVNNWSIALYAGVTDFSPPTPTVATGAGSIYLNAFDPNNPGNAPYDPSGYLKTGSGSITLVAGQDITVGTGYVNTTGGGSITAHALAGSIDTGGYAQGYVFQSGDSVSEGYYVDSTLGVGGISTTAGGDVSLTAGGNVQSLLPGKDGYYYDGDFTSFAANPSITTAGCGAYGTQAGNVTVVAGGDVTGNYLVANGTGGIYAGVQMDVNGNPMKNSSGNYVLGTTGNAGTDRSNPNLALNLISGGWNVTAAENIILQEVRNPNGDFNVNSGGAFHAFDYAPSDYVNLTAGNLVQLGASGSKLPRLDRLDSRKVAVI